MSNASKQQTPKIDTDKIDETEEFKTNLFAKSGWPKTPKEFFKLVVGIVLNFYW